MKKSAFTRLQHSVTAFMRDADEVMNKQVLDILRNGADAPTQMRALLEGSSRPTESLLSLYPPVFYRQQMLATLTGGVYLDKQPNMTVRLSSSFAAACMKFGRFDVLQAVIELGPKLDGKHEGLESKSQWAQQLCRARRSGAQTSIVKAAVKSENDAAVDFALSLKPNQADLDAILAHGLKPAALLRAGLLRQEMARQSVLYASTRVAPSAPRPAARVSSRPRMA